MRGLCRYRAVTTACGGLAGYMRLRDVGGADPRGARARRPGVIPDLSALGALKTLHLEGNLLSGAIPASLGGLGLTTLMLGGNCMDPPVPATVSTLCATLEPLACVILPQGQTVGCSDPGIDRGALLDMYFALRGPAWYDNTGWNTSLNSCLWPGVSCDSVFGTRVVSVRFPANNLHGTIPSTIGTMTHLTYLDLSSNTVGGSLPSTFCALVSLTYLDLHSNALTGPLPACLGALTRLTSIDVSYNLFTGLVPPGIASLPAVTNLQLSRNCLQPPFPMGLEIFCMSGPSCGLGQQGWSMACPDPGVDRGALVALFEGAGGPSWNNNDGWNSTRHHCWCVVSMPARCVLLLLLLLL